MTWIDDNYDDIDVIEVMWVRIHESGRCSLHAHRVETYSATEFLCEALNCISGRYQGLNDVLSSVRITS